MRAIGVALSRLSFKFRTELGLHAARRILELSFSTRHVSQHCVQPLWSQYNESEHNHKQDFSAKTHDSPLSRALLVGNGGCYAVRLLMVFGLS
jgi:hypothetical protein